MSSSNSVAIMPTHIPQDWDFCFLRKKMPGMLGDVGNRNGCSVLSRRWEQPFQVSVSAFGNQ